MNDPRNISGGREIPSENYCDQPYVVTTGDGDWLCVMTTGRGHEGQHGQHVIAVRSADRGQTWSDPVEIEPADGPEASWAMPLIVPGGRVYAFYTYNTANRREVIMDRFDKRSGKWILNGGSTNRVDTLGDMMFKYSDDGGRSWSARRYRVPMRRFQCDRENPYRGEVLFWWGVGKPIVHRGKVYIGFSKVGRFGEGYMARSEGAFLRSDNILTETDPGKIRWETLPDGDVGLRAPVGPVADEHNLVGLSDGSLYCTYRTVDGHPCHAYSRDEGRTWTPPAHMTYTPGGRKVRHPRAANFVWRASNGKFLYWFHNNGTTGYGGMQHNRNPVWLCGGIERDGPDGRVIHWSEPEIVLYDDEPLEMGISYPNFIEAGGRYFLTETQKRVARVHEIEPALIEGLWRQFENRAVATEGLVLHAAGDLPAEVDAPPLPAFVQPRWSRGEDLRAGLTVDLWLSFRSLGASQVVLDGRDEGGSGWALVTTARRSLEIVLCDGRTRTAWDCDPQWPRHAGPPEPGRLHHVTVIVDGGPKIISFVTDGRLNDGGAHRPFGWGRFSPFLRDVNGSSKLKLAPSFDGELKCVRVYNRALRTSEAVGNYRAGPAAG